MEETSINDLIAQGDFYIANQDRGMFDEIQTISIAYLNGHPIAIEGEPGAGKNQSISMVARALGKIPYRIRCTEETMARDIIGGEKLAAEKSKFGSLATKTVFEAGRLIKGLQEDNIVILDEVNQLTPTVQKALNSVLEDTRTIGSLEGDVEVEARRGFGLFLTYNPDTGVCNQDLEIAVKDRCKLMYFENIPRDLKVRISLLKSNRFGLDDFLQDGISVRGLKSINGSLDFVELVDNVWVNFNSKEPSMNGRIEPYLFFDRNSNHDLSFEDRDKAEYYQIAKAIVNSLEEIDYARKNGTKDISRKMGFRLLYTIPFQFISKNPLKNIMLKATRL